MLRTISIILILVLAALSLTMVTPIAKAMSIGDVTIEIDVNKISKGYIYFDLKMVLKDVSGTNQTTLVIYLPAIISSPKLLSAKCVVNGVNIVKNATLIKN